MKSNAVVYKNVIMGWDEWLGGWEEKGTVRYENQ